MTVSVPEGNNSAPERQPIINNYAPATGHEEYQVPRVSIPEIMAVIKRHTRLMATVVLGCTLLSIIACFVLTKIYTASSTLVLERKDIRPFETDVATQALERDKSAAETEMDVLRSRNFLGRVVDRLELVADPEYNPQAEKLADISTTSTPSEAAPNGQITDQEDTALTQSDAIEAAHNRAISVLQSQINVSRTGESLAVVVEVSSSRPSLAAKIANTVANMYVESSLEFKQSARSADKERAMHSGGAVAFLRERNTQPLLTTLRSEEARLAREREELASRLGKNHPKMVGYDSQIASVRKMIDDEIGRILQDLEIEALKPSARVVSLAAVPTTPSFPKPRFIIPTAFIGSSVLALLLALMLEAIDNKIRSGTRVSQILRVPNLGYVPRRTGPGGASASKSLAEQSETHHSILDEALRSIYLACRSAAVTKQLNFVLVTACLDDPASASTAWGVAAAGAADGRKVIYANLDTPPGEHANSAATNRVKRFLKNEISLAVLISEASKTLGSTSLVDATHELGELCRVLTPKNLRNILVSLRRIGYDLIVLHAPPVLVVNDAIWLSPLVDGVILTISWGRTTEEQLIDAATELRLSGAPIIGTLINDVDPHVQARDGYGGRLTYYRQTRRHLESRA
jgi:uncharacterized protein involved in exopolysaccharide biosynthesis/Mrp family chromosome partitioning ATPase